MLKADIKTYFNTWVFWALNGLTLGFLVLYSLLLAGMDRIGLRPMTALDYLSSSSGIYTNALYPLLTTLFSAYVLSSEYRWRTLMVPIFEGVSRTRILSSKIGFCFLSTVILGVVYFCGAFLFGFTLFTSQNMLVENRTLSAFEVVARMSGVAIWTALIMVLFGLLAMLLVIQFKNALVATVGSFLAFLILMITAETRHNPFGPMLKIAQLLQSANLEALARGPLLPGIGIWLLTLMVLMVALAVSFHRQDIVLE